MKRTAMIISGIVLVLGCMTMGFSLLLSAILPHAFLVYLTATPAGFSHEILYPDMTGVYVFSASEIVAGVIGMVCFGAKAKNV